MTIGLEDYILKMKECFNMLKVSKAVFLRKGLLTASIFCLSFLMSCHIYENKTLNSSTSTGTALDAQTILINKCIGCHSSGEMGEQNSNFADAGNFADMKTITGSNGMYLVDPGNPLNSLIYIKVRAESSGRPGARMPFSGGYLSDSEIETIRAWIAGLVP